MHWLNQAEIRYNKYDMAKELKILKKLYQIKFKIKNSVIINENIIFNN